MSSLVDVSIATGLFIVVTVAVVTFTLSFHANFQSALEDSELRSSAANVKNVLLSGKGEPEDWETRSGTPARVGLMDDLFRKPVLVSVDNGTDHSDFTFNFTVEFDPGCANTTRESTVRVYNETNVEHPFSLYNQSYCAGNEFIQSADFTLNATVPASDPKILFVYFSHDESVSDPGYAAVQFPSFPNGTNHTVLVYPTDELDMVSPTKLDALRNLSYSQVASTLGGDTVFRLEVEAI